MPYQESIKEEKKENIIKIAEYIRIQMDKLVPYYDKLEFNDEFITTELTSNMKEIECYTYEIISGLNISNDEKYDYLKELSLERRLLKLYDYLKNKFSLFESIEKIDSRIESKNHDEDQIIYLQEQIKNYQKELDELKGFTSTNYDDYVNKLNEINISENEKKNIFNEISRLKNPLTPEQDKGRILEYLDTLFSLSFKKGTTVNTDLLKAQEILDCHHFGVNKVKDKILENLTLYNFSKKKRAPVICLVGPPGVGKTSFGKSIAEATGREMVRVALGGVKEESEIRGHRRTYQGAKMGRIMEAIKNSGVNNPLILLDEIDKVGVDGSVASALLEVLDPNQNINFRDNFLEVGFDISEVMFVATANSENLPSALLDRMDMVYLSGYSELEKLNIVKKHILPKIFSELTVEAFVFEDAAILKIINEYTQESGVRNLERVL